MESGKTASLMLCAHLALAIGAAPVVAQTGPSLWITDDVTKEIYRIDRDGNGLSRPFVRPPVGATSGIDIDPVDATFWAAREDVVDAAGQLVIGGLVNFNRDSPPREVGFISRDAFTIHSLEGVAVDGDTLWVIDDPEATGTRATVFQLDRDGTVLRSFLREPFNADSPQGIAVDPTDGTLWITDNRQDTIYHVGRDGEQLGQFPAPGSNPQGITVDAEDGTLWLTERSSATIYNLDPDDGAILASYPTAPGRPYTSPVGIAFEADSPTTFATVRDEFETASFSNNDGSVNWAGNWIEDDPDGNSAGSGQVAIVGGVLTLEDRPNSGEQPGTRRRANLAGASSATFSFSFATTASVDSSDAITVDVSSNGGASWTTLEVFTGISGASEGTRNYDITAFASATTEVRFRVTNLYGGSNEFFLVDDVQIAFGSAPPSGGSAALDTFSTVSYGNSDGDLDWAGNWQENDAFGGGATTGQVAIEGNALTLEDAPNTGTQPSIRRGVNLAGASQATFSFGFATTAGVDSSDAAVAEVSANGGASWTVLETFTGIFGSNAGLRCYDISAFASGQTEVRFRVTNLYGGSNEFFIVDDVEVARDAGGC